jgi:hypothetical protein
MWIYNFTLPFLAAALSSVMLRNFPHPTLRDGRKGINKRTSSQYDTEQRYFFDTINGKEYTRERLQWSKRALSRCI